MKRVICVLSLLFLSLFISGYKYDVTITIDEDRSVKLQETYTLENKNELASNICNCIEVCDCNYDDDQVVSILKTIHSSKNKNYEDKLVRFTTTYDENNNLAYYYASYDLGDVDENLGNKSFNLYDLDLNNKLFIANGSTYKLNIENHKKNQNINSTLKLILPVDIESTNGKAESKKEITWDINNSEKIDVSFVLPTTIEETGKDDYGKIEFSKNIMIAFGIGGAVIILIIFINIAKKIVSSSKESDKIQQDSSNKYEVNSIFNENANKTTPIQQETPASITPEVVSNHEDKISSTFMDASFANETNNAVNNEVVDHPPIEPNVGEVSTVQENVQISNEETESAQENVPQNDIASVAFGGTPVGDKNINEIK